MVFLKKENYLTFGNPGMSRALTEILDAEYNISQMVQDREFVSTEPHHKVAHGLSKKDGIINPWLP